MRRRFNGWSLPVMSVLMLLMSGRLARAISNEVTAVSASLAADGRSFTVTAPGLTEFRAGWSAKIARGGRHKVLSSADGAVIRGAEITIQFPDDGVELLFRLEAAPGTVGVLAQAGIRNTGPEPVKLVAVTPVVAELGVAGDPSAWLVTGLHPKTPVVSDLSRPVDVHEYGGFYRRDGTGFLFGPVGEPIAYVNARVAPAADGKVALSVAADMSGVAVEPGETRWGQQVVLLMEKPQAALARWAEWVGQSHKALTAKPALSGWSSWYLFGKKVTGKDVLDVADAVTNNPAQLRPDVIQIDTGYTREKFPEGLAFYAQRIAQTGARPGLKLEFPPASNPFPEIEAAVRVGFRYLKVSFWEPPQNRPKNLTAFEMARRTYTAVRQSAGPDTYLLHCADVPDRALVGLVDASRVGRTALRPGVRAAMDDVLRSFQFNGRWYAIDLDGYYMGTELANVSEVVGGWPLVRTWMSMVGLSCGAAITSDPWNWDAFKPYWRNVEVMTPPATERTEVLDLCTSKEWPRLVSHVRRAWGDATVALLWNPSTNAERVVTLDFAQAGMDPKRRHAVWSFWDNRYLGVAQGSWTTPRLGASASQHLVFTDLEPAAKKPVFIGSNLHIYGGAAEVKRVESERSRMVIELTDAGARDGDLYVYSRYQPVLRKATGCAVDGVTSAGENVWRISLHERQRGAPQRILLAVVLPATQQIWFWALIAGLAVSLLFAVWRYVAGLGLQRQHALAEERARIAQDLHDDLGANLTQIGLISELARRHLDNPESIRDHLDKVFTAAHDLSRQLDSVVWAINPANDTLESLVQYLCKYAQEFLTLANVRCRLAVALELPVVTLTSAQRHNLFLAVKEALHNVVRHAGATLVTVRVLLPRGTLVVEIEDDGKGLPAEKLSPGQDGLSNMPKRMERLGGRCEYVPGANGRGTLVRLTMPLVEKL